MSNCDCIDCQRRREERIANTKPCPRCGEPVGDTVGDRGHVVVNTDMKSADRVCLGCALRDSLGLWGRRKHRGPRSVLSYRSLVQNADKGRR